MQDMLRLALVMADNEFTQEQKQLVMAVYHLWGQHMADKVTAFIIKNKERMVILS